MPIKLFVPLLLFSCMPTYCSFAQELRIAITGQVTDASTGQPLPSVNIAINNNGTATVSNSNGYFQLLTAATRQQDSLRISCIGYQVQYLPIAATEQQHLLRIALAPVSLSLKEVVIEAKDPVRLIQAAIKKIPDNYITTPHQTGGFFRATTTRDQEYIQLSEAVFDIFNPGYASKTGNDLYLLRVRYIRDEAATDGFELGEKPRNLFDYDIVKTISDNKILNAGGLKAHRFAVQGIVDYKGSPAYEITFDQREDIKKPLFRGKLYIDQQSLAFLRIDYETSPKGQRYNSYGDLATRALMNMMDVHISPVSDGASITYEKVGDHWALANVTSNTALHFSSKKRKYNYTANTKVDYVVTTVDTTRSIALSEGKKTGDNKLIEFQTTSLDANFWRKHTIISPDFDAEAVAAQLKAKNESHSFKKKAQAQLQQLPKSPALRIDSLLSFYYQQKQFNGTVLVKTKNGILLNKSYGYADPARQIPADSNTQYRIGSLSKSFTSMVILQLANEGKLQLTDAIRKYLPDYVHGDITIEQLLTHQSGIPNFTSNATYLSQILHHSFSLPELVDKFCSDSLEFTPGSQFQYSNSGYVLLADLIEKICKKPFAEVLKERIFTPAGMHHTYAGNDTTTINTKATGILFGKPEPLYNTTNTLGAAGITTTAADLLKWEDALSRHTLLPANKTAALFQPRAAYIDWDAYYGYGWMIDRKLFAVSATSHVITYHPGTDLGFYTMFVRQEDNGNVIIMLNNTGDFPRFDLADMILTEIN